MDVETGPPVERFGRHYFDRDQAEYLEMIAPGWHPPGAADVTTELVACELAQPQADTFLDQVWRFDVTTLIVDDPVKRVDNMPMAWGLEVRVPFLDHELVELAARMPPELKLKEGGKFPLKAISRGVQPSRAIQACRTNPALARTPSFVCSAGGPLRDGAAAIGDASGFPCAVLGCCTDRPLTDARRRNTCAGVNRPAMHGHHRQQRAIARCHLAPDLFGMALPLVPHALCGAGSPGLPAPQPGCAPCQRTGGAQPWP